MCCTAGDEWGGIQMYMVLKKKDIINRNLRGDYTNKTVSAGEDDLLVDE